MSPHPALRLIGLALLLGANGFFTAAELALITLPQARLHRLLEADAPGATAILRIRQHLELFLSAVQLGVTLCALGVGWAIEPTVVQWLQPLLPATLSLHRRLFLNGLMATFAFLLITYLDIVLAEIVPKSLSLHYTDRMALAVARPMELFMRVTRPFLRVIGGSARGVLKLLNSPMPLASERAYSAEELKLMVQASQRLGQVEPFQDEIIERVLELQQVPVREIMTPRHDVIALPVNVSMREALEFVAEKPRSRIPVHDGDLDHPTGLLYAKDLLRLMVTAQFRPGRPLRSLRSILRPLPVVPESKPVHQLLLEFQNGRAHLAAVVDEFGTFAGVVTIEDVLEQIVGEVQDEYDIAEPLAPVLADEPVTLDGATPIRDLESLYGLEFPRDDSYETVAGFILSRLRRLPRGGETVDLDNFRFTVIAMEGHRIAEVQLERMAE